MCCPYKLGHNRKPDSFLILSNRSLAIAGNDKDQQKKDLRNNEYRTGLHIGLLNTYVQNKSQRKTDKRNSEDPNGNGCGDEGRKHEQSTDNNCRHRNRNTAEGIHRFALILEG